MRVTEGRSHFQVCLSHPYFLVPGSVDVHVWCRVEDLLVLDSFQDALLSVIGEAHVSRPGHRSVTERGICL
jgi:hypothetical protein